MRAFLRTLPLAAALFAGCTDAVTSPSASRAPSPARPDVVSGGYDSPFATARQYDVRLNATGAFKPGVPVQIHVTVHNLLDQQTAHVRVLLPEAGEARKHGWRRTQPTPGQAAPALDLDAHRAIGAGQVREENLSVIFGAPGNYQVNVAVASDAPVFRTADGRVVIDDAAATLWVRIDSAGGGVHARLEGLPAAKGRRNVPGVDPMMIPACDPSTADCCDPTMIDCGGSGDPGPSPTGPAYSLIFTYNDWTNGGSPWAPLRQITVQVSDQNSPTPQSYNGLTDDQGRFHLNCAAGGGWQLIDGYFRTDGMVRVYIPYSNTLWDFMSSVQGVCDGRDIVIETGTSDLAVIHQEMVKSIQASRAVFGEVRGSIDVRYDPSGTDVSRYFSDGDYIYWSAGSNSNNTSGSPPPGWYTRFTAAHEYGHALAESNLGGSRGGGCPSTGHLYEGFYTTTCAIGEGWADYHAMRTRGPELGYWYTDILQTVNVGGHDGSTQEKAFTSFLYALTAPAGQTNVENGVDWFYHYPVTMVTHAMRDCRNVYLMSTFYYLKVGRSDELVWCLEHSAEHDTYDGGHWGGLSMQMAPLGVSNGDATPWNFSSSAVAASWRRKLYNQ